MVSTTGSGFWSEGAGTLRAREQESHEHLVTESSLIPEVANPLTARMGKGINTTCDEGQTLIAHSLRAEGFDASEDGTGRGTPLVTTLAIRGRCDSCDLEIRDDGQANALLAPGGGRGGVGVGAIAIHVDLRNVTSPTNRSNPMAYAMRPDAAREGAAKTPSRDAAGKVRLRDPGFSVLEECSPTLDATAAPIALSSKDSGAYDYDQSPTLRSMGHDKSHASMQVRRITPREAERLQGFPDDWTLIEYRGRPAADGPRYKALGNSMAVPCMAWLGRRIQIVSDLE